MSEPDRFEAQAQALRQELERCGFVLVPAQLVRDCDELIAIELRAAESSALERAAQECDEHAEYFAAKRIRALIPPVAAPAAVPDNMDRCSQISGHQRCTLLRDHRGDHSYPAPAAETGKAPGQCGDRADCDAAHARIAELERVLELAYPFVAEGDEGTEVDGLMHDQIVARINEVMRVRAATPEGEGK